MHCAVAKILIHLQDPFSYFCLKIIYVAYFSCLRFKVQAIEPRMKSPMTLSVI